MLFNFFKKKTQVSPGDITASGEDNQIKKSVVLEVDSENKKSTRIDISREGPLKKDRKASVLIESKDQVGNKTGNYFTSAAGSYITDDEGIVIGKITDVKVEQIKNKNKAHKTTRA